MGYACPVCGTPQEDGVHLANHVAITAMLHDDEHAAWLDDRVADWRDSSPEELAGELTDRAERVDYDEAAVERAEIPDSGEGDGRSGTGHAGHDHADHESHAHGSRRGYAADSADAVDHLDADALGVADGDEFEDDVEGILAEAREMTRQRMEDAAVEGEAEEDAGDAGEGSGDDAEGGADVDDGDDADDADDGDGKA